MTFALSELEIHDEPDEAVALWWVRGIPNTHYPSKIVAEIAARRAFPHEDPDVRYGRVFFRSFFREGAL